jgi:hypothetical protein
MNEPINAADVIISGKGIRSEGHWKALSVITIHRFTNEGIQKTPVAGQFSTQQEAVAAGIRAGIATVNRLFPMPG